MRTLREIETEMENAQSSFMIKMGRPMSQSKMIALGKAHDRYMMQLSMEKMKIEEPEILNLPHFQNYKVMF